MSLPFLLLHQVPLFNHQGLTCGESVVQLPLGVGTVTIDGLACPIAAGGKMALNVGLTLPAAVPSVHATLLACAVHLLCGCVALH